MQKTKSKIMGIWPFKKRQKDNIAEIFSGFTDCHSHILPGVDDGVQTMEESLEILRRYEAWGVSAVRCTPHIMEDYPNGTAALRQRFETKAFISFIPCRGLVELVEAGHLNDGELFAFLVDRRGAAVS